MEIQSNKCIKTKLYLSTKNEFIEKLSFLLNKFIFYYVLFTNMGLGNHMPIIVGTNKSIRTQFSMPKEFLRFYDENTPNNQILIYLACSMNSTLSQREEGGKEEGKKEFHSQWTYYS